MKCAIVGLVRGYDSWYRYKQLIERNDRIHRYFNYKYNYPIIIFHEGNIKKKHQHKLKSLTPNISFVEVTNFHDLPYVKHNIFKRIYRIALKKVCKITFPDSMNGYKNMCAFYAFKIYDYLKDFDYYWRLDEDGMLMKEISDNPFEVLKNSNAYYGYIYSGVDQHIQTLNTLMPYVKNYIKENNIKVKGNMDEINMDNYGSNFMVTELSFWKQAEVQKFLEEVKRQNGVQQYRWGDANIQALALKMFCVQEKRIKLTGFHYYHASHHQMIET